MVTPLTKAQQARVDALLHTRRIGTVPVDTQRAAKFLNQASKALADLPNITYTNVAYTVAYDACHDVGEAMLAAYGYRTLNGPGQHQALGQFLAAVLDSPPGDAAASMFDSLRRTRNQQRYDAIDIGTAQATLAATTAADLRDAAQQRGVDQ